MKNVTIDDVIHVFGYMTSEIKNEYNYTQKCVDVNRVEAMKIINFLRKQLTNDDLFKVKDVLFLYNKWGSLQQKHGKLRAKFVIDFWNNDDRQMQKISIYFTINKENDYCLTFNSLRFKEPQLIISL